MNKSREQIIVLFVLLVFVGLLRSLTVSVPFNPDEGIYAMAAITDMDGGQLYKDVVEMKLPGVFWTYRLAFETFGVHTEAVRLLTTIVVWISMLLLFGIGKMLWNRNVGYIGALAFGAFTVSPAINIASNSEIFMVAWSLLGFLVFLHGLKREGLGLFVLAGVSFGVAYIIKQPSLIEFLGVLLVTAILWQRKNWTLRNLLRREIALLSGFVLPIVGVGLFFYRQGTLADLIYAGITYPALYAGERIHFLRTPFAILTSGWPIVLEGMIIWIPAIIMVCVWLSHWKKLRDNTLILLVLGVGAIGGFVVGGWPTGHYYMQLLAYVSLAGAVGLSAFFHWSSKHKHVGWFIGFIFLGLYVSAALILPYLALSPNEQMMRLWPHYATDREVIDYVNANVTVNDNIYVWGHSPHLYFYTDKKLPTRYAAFIFLRTDSPDEYNVKRLLTDLQESKPTYIFDMTGGEFPVKRFDDFREEHYVKIDTIRGADVYKATNIEW